MRGLPVCESPVILSLGRGGTRFCEEMWGTVEWTEISGTPAQEGGWAHPVLAGERPPGPGSIQEGRSCPFLLPSSSNTATHPPLPISKWAP